jgi:DNA-binding NarL/FixJ family response regulator
VQPHCIGRKGEGVDEEGLSKRSKGATNREIAATLFIAEGTVRNHLANILGKLGVSDCTQAAVKAKELRVV